MKKILFSLLVVALVLGGAGVAWANSGAIAYNRGGSARILTEALTLTTTPTDATTIDTDNVIIGFTYSDSAAGTGTLYDVIAGGTETNSDIFGEISVAAGKTETIIFPMPIALDYGLKMECSTATGTLIVYYE